MASLKHKFEEFSLVLNGYEIALVSGAAVVSYDQDGWQIDAIYLDGVSLHSKLEARVPLDEASPFYKPLYDQLSAHDPISDAYFDAIEDERASWPETVAERRREMAEAR